MSQIIQALQPLRKDFPHHLMRFLDRARDLAINLAGFFFTVGFTAEKPWGRNMGCRGPSKVTSPNRSLMP
jgi:hypothetical protein